MALRLQLGKLRREMLSAVFRRPVSLGELGPVITFSFDDCPRSAITKGRAIVEEYNGRATFYVAMSLEAKKNELGDQFLSADLVDASNQGHEVASHSFSHFSARRTSVDAFLQDVLRGESTLRECVGIKASKNFAFPYGEATLRAKRKVGPQMESCRGTQSGFNGPCADLNLLRANRLYGGTDQLEEAKNLILENEARRSWLIFYTHDVAESPSPFGCTPALLEEVVSFASRRRTRIATVSEVLTEIKRRS